MDYITDAFAYFLKAVSGTFLQILIVLGPGLALGFAMNYVAKFFNHHAYMGMGRTVYLSVFGWLGTTIHELGHAIFCPFFGHRIIKMELFNPDPITGRLGYVRHSYNRDSIVANIGNFFIGIGPILLGTSAIYFFAVILLDINIHNELAITTSDLGSWDGISEVFKTLWDSLTVVLSDIFSWRSVSSWEFYLFLYMAFSIGTSITLSSSDTKGALKGFLALLAALLLFNLGTLWIGDFTGEAMARLAQYCGVFYAMMMLVLVLSLTAHVIILLGYKIMSLKIPFVCR